jgi:hypothetical protein
MAVSTIASHSVKRSLSNAPALEDRYKEVKDTYMVAVTVVAEDTHMVVMAVEDTHMVAVAVDTRMVEVMEVVAAAKDTHMVAVVEVEEEEEEAVD